MTAALGELTNPLAGAAVQRLQAHPIIAQKAAELDLLGAPAGQSVWKVLIWRGAFLIRR
jgi:hypothetical protein